MKKASLSILMVGVLFFGNSALADQVTINSSIEGFYVGSKIGASWGEVKWEDNELYDFGSDFVGGIFAGYNHSVFSDAFVLGIEVGYSPSKVTYTSSTTNKETGRSTYDIYNSVDLNFRIGKEFEALSGSVMPFISGGYSVVDIETKKGKCGTESGFNYGAGVDYKGSSSVIIGFLYVRRDGFTVDNSQIECISTKGFEGETEELVFRIGYGF